jgi:predicted acyl esterase
MPLPSTVATPAPGLANRTRFHFDVRPNRCEGICRHTELELLPVHTKQYAYFGVPPTQTSGLEKFEALDPADWCARGYVVMQADARGCFNSEGDMH